MCYDETRPEDIVFGEIKSIKRKKVVIAEERCQNVQNLFIFLVFVMAYHMSDISRIF